MARKPIAKSVPKPDERKAPPRSRRYQAACDHVLGGRLAEARQLYAKLDTPRASPELRARIANDLAVIAALEGEPARAIEAFGAAAELGSRSARLNRQLLEAELESRSIPSLPPSDGSRPIRVAILSFLFNWPSTGGGTVHTFELAKFLSLAGYEVRHIYAKFDGWGIGQVTDELPYHAEVLEFDEADWSLAAIQQRFRAAVAAFDPDRVIITDSWNIKPWLADAVRGYPYLLRLQALECLCPLNNVRLLVEEGGRFRQCTLHQFASPAACSRCLMERGGFSGALHQAERELCGVGTREYHEALLRAFGEAEAILAVNPLTEAMLSPYARDVRVVTSGFDPARFPWPPAKATRAAWTENRCVFLFAGLTGERMKGFHVLHEACRRLWTRRRDFVVMVTADADSSGYDDAFLHHVGWQSQEELPRRFAEADVLVFPTIAQEALGRTAVEAMAAGLPVVASRIGGLSFTVADGATGLLCEPADADDLAHQLERLIDDPELRRRMGQAGRRRFEEHYTWDVIIERHYRALLGRRDRGRDPAPTAAVDPRLGLPASFLDDRNEPEPIDLPAGVDRLVTSSSPQYTLYRLVRQLRPASILEIGTQLGASAAACALAMRDNGMTPDVVCIDPFRATGDNAGLATLVAWYEYMAACGLLGRGVELILADSRRGLAMLGRRFDLILVDGSHAHDDVRRDFEGALACATPGGHLWFHDYIHFEEVRRAVDEVVAERTLPIAVNAVQRNARGNLCGWCLVRAPAAPDLESPSSGPAHVGESPTPRLSLIVSVLQSHEVVRRQLLHLEEILTPNCELILVDDGSTPPLRGVCAAARPSFPFRLHETHDHRPWTQPRGRNLGAALARADRLLFFDIDQILTREIIELCLDYEGDRLHWLRRPGVLDARGRIVTDPAVLAEHGSPAEMTSMHINSFLIRREVFERLGGYDEAFCGRYGGDDVDLNTRYDRLCEANLARPAELGGAGYAYPNAALDPTGLFHKLERTMAVAAGTDEASAAR